MVIIFSPGFAENESDTTCIPALQQFVIELKKLKPELEILVFSLHYPFVKGSYIWNGINCYSFGGKNKGRPYAWLLRYSAKKHLRELIRTKQVKAIISIWMWDCALISQQLSRELNVPHFCWMHGQDAREMNKLVSKIKPKPEQVIAISDILQAEFEKNHGVRSKFVVDNGITESLFPPFNNERREYDIIGVGSLNSNKNYDLFIDVVAIVKREFPSIRVLVIGDGDQRRKLESKVDHLDLKDNIVFKGAIDHKDVLQYMAKSKIFLHTSHYEGSSGVIMEALYNGCFVVSTVSISLKPVKNLRIASGDKQLAGTINDLLYNKELKHERIVFNTMRHSAQKLIEIIGV